MSNRKRKYDSYPMMTKEEYENAKYINLNICNKDVLDELTDENEIVWLTNISLNSNNILIGNNICPYKVYKINKKYYLRNCSHLYTKLLYDVSYIKYEFKNVKGVYTLPSNVQASTSYEYINRYRHEKYKELISKESVADFDKDINKSHFEFTLEQAKQALADKFELEVKNVHIRL